MSGRPKKKVYRTSCSSYCAYNRQEKTDKALRDSLSIQTYAINELEYSSYYKAQNQWLNCAEIIWIAVQMATEKYQQAGIQFSTKISTPIFSKMGLFTGSELSADMPYVV